LVVAVVRLPVRLRPLLLVDRLPEDLRLHLVLHFHLPWVVLFFLLLGS
jgi:hypothetical protein